MVILQLWAVILSLIMFLYSWDTWIAQPRIASRLDKTLSIGASLLVLVLDVTLFTPLGGF